MDEAERALFGESVRVEKGLRNAWLLNVWRMRRATDAGVTIDYFVRKGHVVVTRIRVGLEQ